MKSKSIQYVLKRLFKLFLANIVVLFCLSILTISLFDFFLSSPPTQDVITLLSKNDDYKKAYKVDPKLFLGQPPLFNTVLEHTKKSGPNLIYKKTYNYNSFGARSEVNQRPKGNNVFLMGGSNTFGEGVANEKVFSTLLSSEYQNAHFFNLAGRGWGPSHSAQVLKNHRFFNELISRSPSIMFYFYYEYHLYRFLGTPQILSQTNGLMPWHEVIEGKSEYKGLMSSKNYFSLFRFFGQFSLWRHLENLFYKYKNKSVELTNLSTHFRYMKELYLKSHPNGKFIVVFPPFYLQKMEIKRFKEKLNLDGVETLSFPKPSGGNFTIKGDGHLNDEGHKYLAQILRPTLKSYFKGIYDKK
ncbi:MAG: hypothetical protein KC493_08540 [Bacteriovoracaceae bacterium]|nr:hypothetical protein [Bacteriovoracaceae bacterium]